MKKLLLFLLASIITTAVFAATYYIDPTCTFNGNGATTSCAASAGAAGASNAWYTAGDLSDGTIYAQKVGTTYTINSGNVAMGSNTTITSYGTGAMPIIVRSAAAASGSSAINTNNNGTVIDGIQVNHTNAIGVYIGGDWQDLSSVTVKNSKFVGAGDQPSVYIYTTPFNVRGITIQSNEFTGTQPQGIQSYPHTRYTEGWNILSNNFHDMTGQGIQTVASTPNLDKALYGFDISWNTFTNLTQAAIDTESGTQLKTGLSRISHNTAINIGTDTEPSINAFQLSYNYGTTIEYNYIENVKASVGFRDADCIILDQDSSLSKYSSGNIVRYNVCKTAQGHGINMFKASSNQIYGNIVTGTDTGIAVMTILSADNSIYNNVAYNNLTGGLVDVAASSSYWYNNIFWGNSDYDMAFNQGTTVPVDGNNCWQVASSYPASWTPSATNVVTTDPKFLSVGSLNFHLNYGSPCINIGKTSIMTTDAAGYTMGFDAGIYQTYGLGLNGMNLNGVRSK